jgi:very-short-patch-repair endonuclease
MEQERYDAERTRWLEGQGYRVLRFWNNQVFDEMEGVLKVISETVEAFPPPRPSPSRGEGDH